MSTLRVDYLQTLDETVTVPVADLANVNDLFNKVDPTKGAALVGWRGRDVGENLDDLYNVKNFGAVGDGSHDDTQAFLDAIAALLTGTESQGGTIWVPRGHYKLSQKLTFNGLLSVTNFFLRGDGMLNTVLDFSGCPPNTDGVYFNGGSQVGVKDIMVMGAPRHGIVLNDQKSSFVSFAQLDSVRVQTCGEYGIYSLQSYLITLNNVFSTTNVGGGANFAGNHTSIISNKLFTANNGGTGLRINGAVYIDINAQSDNNFRGFLFSNIRGGLLRALGTESNQHAGITLESSNATAAGIFTEYQNIQGLVMAGGCHIRNNTAGPVGSSANIEVSALDGRPIEFTMIGIVDNVSAGNPSVAISGTSGPVQYTEIDCQWEGSVVVTPTVVRRNLSNTGKYALRARSSGAVSIASGVSTNMTWDALSENTMGATAAGSDGIVIPAGVSAVHVSACVTWAGVNGGTRYVTITKNAASLTGLPQLRVPATGTESIPMTISTGKPIPVVEGDVIRVSVVQSQGSAVNIEGTTGSGNWFSVEAVR